MDRIRPVVSIGMPVYNGERFVREALDSLLAQSFSEYELIISDNASTDETERICRGYAEKDSRIRYLRQQKNIGALPNFQLVLNEAQGEFFMWAACDDVWDKDWITSLYKRLDGLENFAAFGRLLQIDECSRPVEHPATNNSFEFAGGYWQRRIAFFVEFEGKGKANLFYSLFRRETLLGMDLSKYDTDYFVLFDLLAILQFVSVDNVLLYKRIHASSGGTVASKTVTKRLFEMVTLQFLWRNYCVAKGYLNHAERGEYWLLAALIPFKIINVHIFYARRAIDKLMQISSVR